MPASVNLRGATHSIAYMDIDIYYTHMQQLPAQSVAILTILIYRTVLLTKHVWSDSNTASRQNDAWRTRWRKCGYGILNFDSKLSLMEISA